jgi:hypothetical protein
MHFGSMVDHEGDSLVESFVVHLPSVGQVGRSYDGKHLKCPNMARGGG